MLTFTSSLLASLAFSQVQALPFDKWFSKPATIDRSFYVRAVPNDANFTIQGSLPSGQESALGRIRYDISTSTGEICWDIDTEGIEWDSEYGESALSIKEALHDDLMLTIPDFKRQSSRNGLNVEKASGCRHSSKLLNDGFEMDDLEYWEDLIGEVKAINSPGLTLQGPLIPAEVEIDDEPEGFTSHFFSQADWTQVINGDGTSNPGPEGARATFDLKINSEEEIICYEITTWGVKGEYFNAGRTATHLGGLTGPSAFPRIAFKNPSPVNRFKPDGKRFSSACVKGPFAAGRVEFGVDSGSQSGFTLKKFEQDPSPYFVDMHTFDHSVGVVRGALERIG